MCVSETPVVPDHLLSRVEELGLIGTWTWTFGTGEHSWSAGLFRLLGLESHRVRPSYGRFLACAHPEDRPRISSAAAVRQGASRPEQIFRIVSPDGVTRTLSVHLEIHRAADGRPRSASGIVIDVTDRERLSRARALERKRRLALARAANVSLYWFRTGHPTELAEQYSGLFEPALAEFLDDPYSIVAAEHREAAREHSTRCRREGTTGRSQRMFRMAGGSRELRTTLEVPVLDAAGRVIERTGLIYPARSPVLIPGGLLRQGLEQAVQGRHLRAARALLDWSMTQLAEASGLSLSTVRRLEEGVSGQGDRSRHRALAALSAAGIRFVTLEDGTLAVAMA